MIKSFNDKESEKIFNGLVSRKLPPGIQARVFSKLAAIHAANIIEDLKIPSSNHLEVLKGDRKGQYSIRINDQYRICFHWNDNRIEKVFYGCVYSN
jgi:proteic killer suppression protein